MNLNFSKFHKIECDDNCTTLQHPNGHEIKIHHKSLSPKMREELEKVPMKMADGEMVKGVHKNELHKGISHAGAHLRDVRLEGKHAQEAGKSVAKKEHEKVLSENREINPKLKGLAKGGEVSHAWGTDVPSRAGRVAKSSNTMPGSPTDASKSFTEPQDQGGALAANSRSLNHSDDISAGARNAYYGTHGKFPPCINSSCKSYGMPHPNCKCYGPTSEAGTFFADGGSVESYCSSEKPHQKDCEYFKDGGSPGMNNSDIVPKEPDNNDILPPTAEPQHIYADEGSNIEQEEKDAESAANKIDPQPPAQDVAQATNPNPEVGPASTVDQLPPQAPQPMAAKPSTPMDQFQEHKQNAVNEMYPEAQAFKADLDSGHIQPETYKSLYAKKDTLGKIGTLFGLMLGGFGSGVSGQPNAVMEMMNKQIDNDLHAQESSVQNKQNFLKINQQNVMNKAQAANVDQDTKSKAFALAKVQMNMTALHSLVDATQKLPPGPQKDQAMQTLAMMNQGVQNENFNIMDRAATAGALYKTMMGGQNGANTMGMKSGLFGPEAKEIGSDIESKTVPGVGQGTIPVPQQARDEMTAMKTLQDKANDLLAFSKKHVGTLSPSQRKIAAQKADEMVNFYNASIKGGVLTQGRLAWLDSQISKNPTGVVTQLMGNNARLQEIADSNNHRQGLLMKQYGIKPSGGDVQAPQSSGQTKIMNGIKYKKVAGGWQKF